jgi:flagellar biosynthesis/type III secretory pathway M-ring protein FliF/YscJ
MKKVALYSWTILATAGCLYFGLLYLKTDFQTLYLGLDKSARKEIVSYLHIKRSPYLITKTGDEIKVPASAVSIFREELGKKISCSTKI